MVHRAMLVIAMLSSVCLPAKAQTQQAPFKPLRYEDRFDRLNDSSVHALYPRIKHLPLARQSTAYVSIGGESRIQYFSLVNDSWGDSPKEKDNYLLLRNLIHSDWHFNHKLRVFLQLQNSISPGKFEPSPVDKNLLSIHQLFVDLGKNEPKKIFLRIGRQEMLLGSQRLIAVREGPNSRQSFDAFKIVYSTGLFKGDLFYAQPMTSGYGVFDDKFNFYTKVLGAYFTRRKVLFIRNLDFYSLALFKNSAHFDDGNGKESRYSFGARIWDNAKSWKYDIEAVTQFGTFAEKSIFAYTFSLQSSKTFHIYNRKIVAGLKSELISGDKNYYDHRLGTFNALFPRGGYFGLAALIGPANLVDFHPSLDISLNKLLILIIDYDLFLRHSINDGIYAANTSLLYSGKNSSSKQIGEQLAGYLVLETGKHLYFRLEFTWFKCNRYLKEVSSGKDILFGGITIQLKW